MLSYKNTYGTLYYRVTLLSGSLRRNKMLIIIAFVTYRCFIYIIHGCPGLGVFFLKLSVNSSQVIQH